MIIGTKTNGANPVLIAKTVVSSATASVIFDRVFTNYYSHYKLIISDLNQDSVIDIIDVILLVNMILSI